jgi:hypothetical protein
MCCHAQIEATLMLVGVSTTYVQQHAWNCWQLVLASS